MYCSHDNDHRITIDLLESGANLWGVYRIICCCGWSEVRTAKALAQEDIRVHLSKYYVTWK